MRVSEFVFDSVDLLHYNFHKISSTSKYFAYFYYLNCFQSCSTKKI